MSVHLCFQEAYRLQFPCKSSHWTFNQSLFPVSKSHLTLLCCPFGRDFVLFFSGLSLGLCTSLFFRTTLQNLPGTELWSVPLCWMVTVLYFVLGCHCFKKDPGSFGVFTTDGEAVPSRIMASQLWLWKYRGRFSTSKLCACFLGTPAFAQAVCSSGLAVNFILMHMTCSDRRLVLPFLRVILYLQRGFTHWISKANPLQFSEWLSQYLCRMSIVPFPEEPFQAFFLTCRDYQKGVKSALGELGLTLFWSL